METVALSRPSRLSVWEEMANAVTHGLGLILSIWGMSWLLTAAQETGDFWKLGSAALFGTTLIVLYAASTLYHTFQTPHVKRRLKIFDHCAIYTLIAGSYTPFTLVTLPDPWGWGMFVAIWSLALIGMSLKIYCIEGWELLSTVFYLGMGWLVVMAFRPLMDSLATEGLYLLVAGGLSYTFGALFYVLEKPIFHHAIWHLFVLGGSACHYFSVLYYVL